MNAHIYIEGSSKGRDSKYSQTACREAFSRLFEKIGLKGNLPRIHPCGPRNEAFKEFMKAHLQSTAGEYIALLVDSEEPVGTPDSPWQHLKDRDNWDKPQNAEDEQVFLMTTSMETWLIVDRDALKQQYGKDFQEKHLTAIAKNSSTSIRYLENRNRKEILAALKKASSGKYAKGEHSFDVLKRVAPATLEKLPAFARMKRILTARLRKS